MSSNTNITLSELQDLIKQTLADGFRGGVWVMAEIGEMKVNAASGHCYLELVEKGGKNGVPKARASATIWRQHYGMLSAYFTGATGEEIKTGMKILFKATVTYHELYGLSLNITDIDPLYTLGDLERQRQETIARLREDGVFELNRELDFPPVPQRLAVVSSPGAAGYQDFVNELGAGIYKFEVTLFESIMQGHGAESSIINALSSIADDTGRFDAVVIIRGGGSQSDLSFLNSYLLNFHIAQFPLPVIAGLGHYKDQSILDMVAAVSLKTPTAVAGFLIKLAEQTDAGIDRLEDMLHNGVEHIIESNKAKLQSFSKTLSYNSIALTKRVELRLGKLQGELLHTGMSAVARKTNTLDLFSGMLSERSVRKLSAAGKKITNISSLIASRDPEAILSLGFAIVRKEGRAIKESTEVAKGDTIDIFLHKGRIKAKRQ